MNPTRVKVQELKFRAEDKWLKEWIEKHGNSMLVHPNYLALKGDKGPLEQWCSSRQDIWLMERLDLLFDVYKSLIRYGQIQPIIITRDRVIVSGEKRASVYLVMGKEEIEAVYENS